MPPYANYPGAANQPGGIRSYSSSDAFRDWLTYLKGGPAAYSGLEHGTNQAARLENISRYQFSGYDEQGFPIGVPLVPARDALFHQFQSERVVAARNAQRRRDAIRSMGQAREVFESFRPGGVSALAAGIYGNQAQMMFNDQIAAPDLMSDFRRHEQFKQRQRARKASNMALAGNIIKAAGIVAAPFTGGASLLAGPAVDALAPGQTYPSAGPGEPGSGAQPGAPFKPGTTSTLGAQQQPGQQQPGPEGLAQAGTQPQGPQVGAGEQVGASSVPRGTSGAPEAVSGPGGAGVAAAGTRPEGGTSGAGPEGAVQAGHPMAMGDFSLTGVAAGAAAELGPLTAEIAPILADAVLDASEGWWLAAGAGVDLLLEESLAGVA